MMGFAVKVCGLTRMKDVLLCRDLGVSYLGFIFHEGSPRAVDPGFAASVDIPGALKVGVFVNQSAEEISRTMKRCRLDLAQLHGGQSPEFCRAVGADRVIKVFWPERFDSPDALDAELLLYEDACSAILYDSGKSGGGHGRMIRPDAFQRPLIDKPWFLAGGIGTHNIEQALKARPDVLDLSSSVEAAPGIKDHDKVRALMARVREER